MSYISVSSQTTLNDPAHFFVFAIYNATAPTVLIEKVAPAKPYGDPLQITFTTNFTPGLYRVKLWESVDNTATGTVRNDFTTGVGANSILVRLPIYMQADIFPTGFVSGVASWADTSLVGWDWTLERKGQGTLFPDSTAATVPDYHQEVTGGWTLLVSGDVIQPSEEFIIFFTPQVIPAAGGTASPLYQAGRIITTDTTLANTDRNTALVLQGATTVLNITMPTLASVADFDPFYIFSNGGSHINASIICQGSDRFAYDTDRIRIILGRGETLKTFRFRDKYYVDNDLIGVKQTGEFVYNYGLLELNTVLCNGQLLMRLEYPRLWAFIQSLGAGVTSDSSWNSSTSGGIPDKRGYFSTGDGSTTFRLPQMTNMMLKGVDGSGRTPGTWQRDNNREHGHAIDTTSGITTANDTADPLRGQFTGSPNTQGGEWVSGADNKTIKKSGASEATVRNFGAYCLIRI